MKRFLLLPLLSLFCLTVSAQDWIQLGNEMPGEVMGDLFGTSASISADGNTVAVGAPMSSTAANKAGQIQVFTYSGSTWSQKGGNISGEAGMERLSNVSLSADGNIMAIAALDNGGYSVKARVFDFDGADWVQRGVNITSQSGSLSGGGDVDISADGSRVIFGNPGYNEVAGQIKVFEWDGSAWAQLGSDLNGTNAGDGFGTALSLSADGNTFVLGAPRSSPINPKSGEVKIYEYNGSEWTQKGDNISGEQNIGLLGSDVGISADGNTIIAGEDGFIIGGSLLGRTRILAWDGFQWIQKGSDIEGVSHQDRTGRTVAINSTGNIVATQGLGGGGSEKGNARMFKFDGVDWVQLGQTLMGSTNSSDLLGSGMDFSDTGNRITIGSPRHTTSTGLMQVYQFDGPLKIEEPSFAEISIYPSPTQGTFTIDLGDEYTGVTLQISNILGQVISIQNYASANKIEAEITDSPGVYLVSLTTAKGVSKTFRIIKQ